jgi:hypothetical protein
MEGKRGRVMAERRCLRCGMAVRAPLFDLGDAPPRLACRKCDENLYQQHDGKILTRDIAHQQETIPRALEKLDALLLEGWRGYWKGVRIVVGGGAIRREVLAQLHHYRQRGVVRDYREDSPNRGAIVALLRAS